MKEKTAWFQSHIISETSSIILAPVGAHCTDAVLYNVDKDRYLNNKPLGVLASVFTLTVSKGRKCYWNL